MSDQAISISNVHKAYGSLQVLKGIDLDVPRGTTFGLLGPNGAGKTTLIHTILGLLHSDDGTVRVFGVEDRARLGDRIGYLPERPRYHTVLTGHSYLKMLGKLSGLHGRRLLDRVEAAIDLVGLGQAAERRVGTYSKGMLQRLGIAQAVLHEPDLLVVDEPASGLDPSGQREMALLLHTLKEQGHTIFLCSHRLTEVARLCDRIGVLVDGQIEHQTTLAELYAQGQSVTITVAELPLETARALQAIGPQVRAERGRITLFPTSDALVATVLRRLLHDEVVVQAVLPEADVLEQFYLNAVQGRLPSSRNGGASLDVATPEALLQTLIEDR